MPVEPTRPSFRSRDRIRKKRSCAERFGREALSGFQANPPSIDGPAGARPGRARVLETLRHDFAGEKGHARDIDGQMAAVAYRQGARVPQSILLRADEVIE